MIHYSFSDPNLQPSLYSKMFAFLGNGSQVTVASKSSQLCYNERSGHGVVKTKNIETLPKGVKLQVAYSLDNATFYYKPLN